MQDLLEGQSHEKEINYKLLFLCKQNKVSVRGPQIRIQRAREKGWHEDSKDCYVNMCT
jgi:hypothetical protein